MTTRNKEFHEAMADKGLKDEFYVAIAKEPEDFDDVDMRALIKRMGYLTDDERYKFRYLLVEENLTRAERIRYERIYPERSGGGLLHKYFPKRADVDEHYKTNFLHRGD